MGSTRLPSIFHLRSPPFKSVKDALTEAHFSLARIRSGNRLPQALKQVLFNQLFVTLPMSIVSFYLMKWGDLLRPVHVLPSFHEVLIELAILIVIEEIGFYYAHR